MGEEDKKQQEETKTEEPEKVEESSEANKIPPPPDQPQLNEIVLRVFMHCEGCARKVRRCLHGFQGVESVHTDCTTHKVVVKVKGEKADPLKVLGRVQRKSHRRVELISPIPD
ncbi:heavy metal-associated isoprenylated plant protein 7-like [Momordica charantia]|uniref:Heavy metal-associated isoprenylated plant protein 7-like n=1 Tax=Momordica charantia TaxID=3673 RepID=A0A6J1BZ62_MOMCH|nr:heavy metal-associated isoprenylated plant protein 7-like [Momordica charantia]